MSVAYLVSNNHHPCIHSVETTIRQNAIYSVSNSLNINHREKDLPSLRPDGANKTPLQRFAKCPSIESTRAYTHRKVRRVKSARTWPNNPKLLVRDRVFCLWSLLRLARTKGAPLSTDIFAFIERFFLSPPPFLPALFRVLKTTRVLSRCSSSLN